MAKGAFLCCLSLVHLVVLLPLALQLPLVAQPSPVCQHLCLWLCQPLNAPLLFFGWLLHLCLVAQPPLAVLLSSSVSCCAVASCRLPLATSKSHPLVGCCTATSRTTVASCRAPLVLLMILFPLAWLYHN